MLPTRRSLLAAGGLGFVLKAGGLSLPVGIAQAQGLTKQSWMSPSRITLLQAYTVVGKEKGYYAEEGLDLEIQQSSGTASSVSQVAGGVVSLGQSAPATTAGPIANDGLSVVTIGQISYKSFFELASLPGRPMLKPQDWQGKTIGIMSTGGSTDNLLDAMSIAEGLDPRNVKKVITGLAPQGYAFLERGQVDAFFVFYETRVALEQQGINLTYLSTDAFAPQPGDALICSTKLAEDPAAEKALVSFIRASRRAIEFYSDPKNDEEVLRYLTKYNPIEGRNVPKGKRVLELVRGYMTPPEGTPRMVCNEAQWRAGIDLMERIGIIRNKGLPLDRYMTNRFALKAAQG